MDQNQDGFLERDEVFAFMGNICQEYGLSQGNVYEKPPNKRTKELGKLTSINGVCEEGALAEFF